MRVLSLETSKYLERRGFCLKGQVSWLLHLRNKSRVIFDFWQFKYRSHSICQRHAPDRTCARDKQKGKKMSLFTLHVIANIKAKEFSFMRENCVWLKQWIKRAMTCTHCKWNVTCINGMQWNSWVYTWQMLAKIKKQPQSNT